MEGKATPLRTAPAVDATGRVLLHVQGRLLALEEVEGHPKICWEYVTNNRVPGPTTIAPDGTLRLHCSDGYLHCLDANGKQVYAPVAVGLPLGWAAPIADGDGNTWLSAYDGGLIKVDPAGRMQGPGPYFRSRQHFDSSGIVREGVLYIGSDDGYVFAIRLAEDRGENLWDHAAERGSTGWYIHGRPAMSDDGILVVAGYDENLYGFGHDDGRQLWRTAMPGQLLASPVIDHRGQVYIGVSQSQRGRKPRGLLICMDGNSHKIRWQYEAAGPIESTPVIGDDEVIYFGDNAGVIHAIDFSGQAQWTAQVEAAVRSAGTIPGPERLAFGLDNETLVVLKCSSKGLAEKGWPKIGRTLGQCGLCE